MLTRLRSLAVFFSLLVVVAAYVRADEEWSRFRGPNGEGISNLRGLPVSWSESDFEWSIQTPGTSTSSPVVWGKRVFVTSGQASGVRTLFCVNGDTGAILWQESTPLGTHNLHVKNSYAAGTPVADAQRVYVAFADEDHCLVTAYTHDGSKVWSRDFGGVKHQHGFGMSPIIYQDFLIFMNDQEGPSETLALDCRTGETKWHQPRPHTVSTYSTPSIARVNGNDQLILLSKAVGLSGTDPLTGKQLWSSGTLPLRTVASPLFFEGQFFASCGEQGRGLHMISYRPQAAAAAAPVTVERKANVPYVPTPVIVGQYLYLWNDDGIVCCTDLKGDFTGNVWRERIGGTYSGSPVVVDGKIYCAAEDGQVAVVAASPEFKNFGKSPLGELTYSTPAVGNGRLYLRGVTRLISLKAK